MPEHQTASDLEQHVTGLSWIVLLYLTLSILSQDVLYSMSKTNMVFAIPQKLNAVWISSTDLDTNEAENGQVGVDTKKQPPQIISRVSAGCNKEGDYVYAPVRNSLSNAMFLVLSKIQKIRGKSLNFCLFFFLETHTGYCWEKEKKAHESSARSNVIRNICEAQKVANNHLSEHELSLWTEGRKKKTNSWFWTVKKRTMKDLFFFRAQA